MNTEFTTIIQTLVTEQGNEALLDAAKCRAMLADYTRGEYKKESRLLLQAIEAGVAKAIEATDELDLCKQRQVRMLQDEYFLAPDIAADVVDMLAGVLRGEQPQKQPAAQPSSPPPVAAPSQTAPVQQTATQIADAPSASVPRKKHTKRNVAIAAGVVVLIICAILIGGNSPEKRAEKAKAHFDKAVSFYEQKKYDEAIQEYTAVLKIKSNYSEAFVGRGDVYYAQENYDKAIEDYSNAIILDSSDDYALYSRGWAYLQKKNYDKAISDYDEAIRINSGSSGNFFGRGLAYELKDDSNSAIRDYDEAIRLNPQNENAKNNLSKIIAILQANAPNGFVYIKAGTFIMGSPLSELGRDSDQNQHQVTLSGFYMGKYEGTQAEYRSVMARNPSDFRGDNLPVEQVSWFDMIEYCNKRSVKEGLSPTYTRNGDNVTWNQDANGYRLPTEAEWEYACRAGTTTPFNTGNNITTSEANYNGNDPYNGSAKGVNRGRTTEVGSFAANNWGLYDMHGNVQEWCWNRGGDYSIEAQTNPTGVGSYTSRVLRGGCWAYPAYLIRSASRTSLDPEYGNSGDGFRLVRNVE